MKPLQITVNDDEIRRDVDSDCVRRSFPELNESDTHLDRNVQMMKNDILAYVSISREFPKFYPPWFSSSISYNIYELLFRCMLQHPIVPNFAFFQDDKILKERDSSSPSDQKMWVAKH